jgi:hypothetical protein
MAPVGGYPGISQHIVCKPLRVVLIAASAVGDCVEGVIAQPSVCKSSVRPNPVVRQNECSAAVAVSIVHANPGPSAPHHSMSLGKVIWRAGSAS